ncbi:hypothetical protein [Nesterenkonia pannonica]|uniref:hypothetical protein n=1 Tax=Nesterenkonia pannonica TaxID=1548602 RepID=UPI002164C401|nr:hypothetical protein [Nesterenkonia pannonica]
MDINRKTQSTSRKWTEADIPDLTGKSFIVTGATAGLGEVTARALSQAGDG